FDREIDPLDVGVGRAALSLCRDSQDLARPPASFCYDAHRGRATRAAQGAGPLSRCPEFQTADGREEPCVKRIICFAYIVGLSAGCAATEPREPPVKELNEDKTMQLGNFSVSLAVKDLAASRAFYEKL